MHLGQATDTRVKTKQLAIFAHVNQTLAERIAAGINMTLSTSTNATGTASAAPTATSLISNDPVLKKGPNGDEVLAIPGNEAM